jgi:signal peptidase II
MTDAQLPRPFDLRSRLLWFLWLLPLVGLDQLTKEYAVREIKPLGPNYVYSCLNDMVRVLYAENKGAFGSLGANLSETGRFWLLILPNLILLPGLTYWMLATRDIPKVQFASLGMILAGGIGNVIDRLRLGYVIDFLNMGVRVGGFEKRTNIFNVADMYILFGTIVLVLVVLRGEPAREPSAAT